ncbi:hypothetical protein RB608_15440 [Nocardioides sp. LHD-245]|uniref:hypothetical protein n=1 Tax=Nocardioides sp. LHD-245 TaxID=3051387 RepID=UPI0027E1DC79|nr:hypothetical protein [Nocardioides sp. LHD-245]
MTERFPRVRPTLRCLGDLGESLPDIGKRLDELDEPVVVGAQSLPERRDAGGAERVLALTDRVWFKVKTSDRRAVVTELRRDDLPDWVPPTRGSWWIGAAGRRQSDSAQHDFYAVLEKECTTGKTVSSEHLLPLEKDWKRLALEQAFAWRVDMKRLVVRLVAESVKSGRPVSAEFRNHRITALVRADNGHEGYLAIVADGIADPEMYALLLDAVPEVSADDWQLEPSKVAGLEPKSGQLIWSTLFPPEVASRVLEMVDE